MISLAVTTLGGYECGCRQAKGGHGRVGCCAGESKTRLLRPDKPGMISLAVTKLGGYECGCRQTQGGHGVNVT